MVRNRWADPDGAVHQPPSVRYRIRDRGGSVVQRRTWVMLDALQRRYYHSLHPDDQTFADAIVALVQRVCAYFYATDEEYVPLEGVPAVIVSDEAIAARIERLERGENTREALRTNERWYPLSELPFDQQRALVEQIELLKREWRFEIIGPDGEGAP